MISKHRHLSIVWITTFFILTAIYVYFYNQNTLHSKYLRVVFLDIGQGDSIYIEAPNGRQVLVDGGPDARVVNQLSSVMPLFDTSIDLVVATHADADHIGGLPTVLDEYSVSRILENGAGGKTKTYQRLEQTIIDHNVQKDIARRGMHIVLDEKENIYLDILYPDREVAGLDSNDGSIVGKLTYGNKSFMLTGDAPNSVESVIIKNEKPEFLKSSILKIGHHGSHTSSSLPWLQAVSPSYAIISAGLHNKYGHPHAETLDKLKELQIPYLATYEKGNIEFDTDGVSLWQK
jgi:competence protein ComEC